MTHQHDHSHGPTQGGPPNADQAAQARAKIQAMKQQFEQKKSIADSLSEIKYKIGVYSGKGGVGKTTVAVNLAVALAQEGAKVGILDVDIDCPNVIRAMKISEPPTVGESNRMIPPERFGVSVMSMGFFQQNENEATIWRGPMIHNAINQLLQTTMWGSLDYLIMDLPPGTSDAPLTIMQALTIDGFVVVTTPQELAKVDATRSINMIKTMRVDVLGVIENFSGDIFGSGAGEELAQELDLNFLGRVEMRADYRDVSKPTVLTSKTVRDEYKHIAGEMQKALDAVAVGA